MEFGWVYLCLSVTLGGCSGQLSTSSEGLVGHASSGQLLSSIAPASMLPENEPLMTPNATAAPQGHSTELSSVDDKSTSAFPEIAPSASATPAVSSGTPTVSIVNELTNIPVVKSDATSISPRKKTLNETQSLNYQALDASFKYDYNKLRHVGLGIASIFFLTGILVIASSRLTKIPKCRTRSGK